MTNQNSAKDLGKQGSQEQSEDNLMVEYIGAEYPRGDKKKQKIPEMYGGMSDSQLRDFMSKDPEAAKFMEKMITRPSDGNDNSNERQAGANSFQVRNNKMNLHQGAGEKYKWPYYDSYAPKVPMYEPDK